MPSQLLPVSSLSTVWVSGCIWATSRSPLLISTQNFAKTIYTLGYHSNMSVSRQRVTSMKNWGLVPLFQGIPKDQVYRLMQLIKNEPNKRCLLLILSICYFSILPLDLCWAVMFLCWCPCSSMPFHFPTASGVSLQGPEGREECNCTLKSLTSSWWLENTTIENTI